MAVSKPLPGTQIDRTAPAAQNILAAYAFNEGGGLRVNDSVGIRNAVGTAVALTWGGNGGNFNGTSTYVDVSGVKQTFTKTSRFSSAVGFKTSSAAGQYLISDLVIGVTAGWAFVIQAGGSVSLGLYSVTTANSFWVDTVAKFNDGKPHVAAFTYDGSNAVAGISIYVDGVKQAVTTNTVGTGDPGAFSNSYLWLGKVNYVAPAYLVGSMSFAALWAGTLPPSLACAITANPWQLWPDDLFVYSSSSTYPAWVLSSGGILYKQAATGSDRKIYLSSGQLTAKTSASAGDKLLTLSSGVPLAT